MTETAARRPAHTAARYQGPRCPGCNKNKASPARRGNLCLTCSLDPAIRDRFPYSPRYTVNRGLAVEPSAEPIPCPWPPGTEENLAVLARRAKAGQPLFQPGDATDWRERPWATPLPPETTAVDRGGRKPCGRRRRP